MTNQTSAKRIDYSLGRYLSIFIFPVFLTTMAFAYIAGDLDTTFGGDGKVTTHFSPYDGQARTVAIQMDGRIVAAGPSYNGSNFDFALVRYNEDGSLDTSFDGDGKVTTDFGPTNDTAMSVAIQSDGKIVTAGTIVYDAWNFDFAVVRYNSDGSLDTSFDGDGKVTTDFGTTIDIARSIAIQSDGKIVVVGESSYFSPQNVDFAVVRYNPDGSLDTSFDGDGKVTTPIGPNDDYARSVAIQSDGKIVAAGGSLDSSGYPDFAVARYNTFGSLDASFDGDGKLTTPVGASSDARAVAIQFDGKIVVAGASAGELGGDLAVVRYDPGGSLDTTFNSDGRVTTDLGTPYDEVSSIAIQSDGKIVVAGDSGFFGESREGIVNDFAVVRYRPDGSLDATFSGDGETTIDFENGSDDGAYGLALDSQGRAVVAGYSRSVGHNSAFAIARLLMASPAKFDFDGDGRADISVFRPSDAIWYLQQSADGFAAARWGVPTDKIVPADYDGDGKTDVAVYRPSEGNWYVLRSSDGTLFARNQGYTGGIPVPADLDADGEADLILYVPFPSSGVWSIRLSSGSALQLQFGTSEDRPVVGDYNGDGRADLAVFRPSNGTWYWSSDLVDPSHNFTAVPFGLSDDLVTPGDYDGDGKTDVAVYRPLTGTWYSLNSSNGAVRATQFGIAEDIPTAADYDGDGSADISVFRPSDGTWYRLNSANGSFFAVQFGATGDRPTPGAFNY